MIYSIIKGLNSEIISSEFNQLQEKRCPNCPGQTKRNVRPEMDEIEYNYSGCGFDIYECPECEKRFKVSYCVSSITKF